MINWRVWYVVSCKATEMRENNQHFLVVTLLGSDQLGLLEAFTKISKQCGCNVLESKLSSFGKECTLIFHYVGSWDAVAKLEIMLPPLCQQLEVALHMRRTTLAPIDSTTLPYHIQITAHDRVGILNEIAYFFLQNRITIDKMDCETTTTRNKNRLANISLLVNISNKRPLSDLREKFINYCDELNLDAMIEPARW